MVIKYMDEFKEVLIKEKIKNIIVQYLSRDQIIRAEKDHHARRKPRPCGFTIHTGIGCSFKCLYCYIGDMGFSWDIKEYPLNGYQIVYALLTNPYFIPGEEGSLIAIGSVTEPFHGATREKTFDYIDKINRFLKNPVQFSTKSYLTFNDSRKIALINKNISALITIISIKYAEKIEPRALPPIKRYETINNLKKAGLKPILFLRPIIPGIIESEYMDLIDKAKEYGAIGIVAGSLRVTTTIIERFKKIGIPVDEILKRMPHKPRGREQVSIYTADLKDEIRRYVLKNDLLFFPEACMANLYTHGKICWKMIMQNIITPHTIKLKYPSKNDVLELAEELGIKLEDVKINRYTVNLWSSKKNWKNILLAEIIHSRYKICVKIKYY